MEPGNRTARVPRPRREAPDFSFDALRGEEFPGTGQTGKAIRAPTRCLDAGRARW
jgi:hypothetical protein